MLKFRELDQVVEFRTYLNVGLSLLNGLLFRVFDEHSGAGRGRVSLYGLRGFCRKISDPVGQGSFLRSPVEGAELDHVVD